ncbi:hypothetical protein L2E82_44843 [Cichorium intybus]|uniref:Uncharacterized protein n=1 Tax=Cichorium intybus TaxID=13427 RepID=A0ACB8ZQC9_CICIN|nr:hypothetical protein L2E82_44843 [Cichorium intybus]
MTPISPPEQEEVFVCQTCGDVGFTNAFVYCVKCLEFVIHRYCLNVIPKTFTEHVIWHCESCKSTVQNQVTSPQIISLQSQTKKAKKDIDPIWRGSFNVLGGDYDDLYQGLVGHLSEKACVKVYEEANLMPSLLHLEMHSKALLWPKSFQDCEPSDDHIALYFFPDTM